MSQPIEELLQQCTVRLNLPGKYGHGTGFFVAPGLILTCAHVVKGLNEGERITVRWQGQDDFAQADIEQTLPTFDLALLRFTPPEGSNVPCVYLDESVKTGDPLYLFGYPDQDFPNGCPVTFNCEGLTGDTPPLIKFKLGQVRPGMSGSPLLNRRTGKVCGIVKFTRDRSIDLGGGAVPTSVIVTELGKLKQLQRTFHKRDRRWQQLVAAYDRIDPRLVGIASAGAILLVLLVRFLGALQPLELLAYDLLMSRRLSEEADERIAIVGVTGVPSATDKVSDEKLLALLQKLQGDEPEIIGLDIYRGYKPDDCSTEESCEYDKGAHNVLVQHLKDLSNNIISICQVGQSINNRDAYPPSPEIGVASLGFADAIRDGAEDEQDSVIRRHLLAIPPNSSPDDYETPCKTPVSLSLRLAFYYLEAQGIAQPENEAWKWGDFDLWSFVLDKKRVGGYQRPDENHIYDGGFQILLNYRHPRSNQRSFEFIEIEYDKLKKDEEYLKKIDFSAIKGRIVIVGYFAIEQGKNPDDAPVPFAYRSLGYNPNGDSGGSRIPGSFIQAHKVSQLVNAVLEDRPLIWVWPEWLEGLWTIGWGAITGIIVWRFRGLHLVLASIGTTVIVTVSSYVVLSIWGGWLPLIPPLLGTLLITLTIKPTISLLKHYSPKLIQLE